MPLTKWVHLAVAFDGTTAALFVNGRMAISEPCPQTPDQFLAPNVATGQQQNYLGRGMGHLPFFKGAIDSFRAYSKALLNDGEVAREMEREPRR